MRKLTILLVLVCILVLVVGMLVTDGFSVESSSKETDNGCGYNGAFAEVTYNVDIPLETVIEQWKRAGWSLANPDADIGHTVVTLIEGSFEGTGWVVASAYNNSSLFTKLDVWVNQSQGDSSEHEKQAKKAARLLNKIRGPIEKMYKLPQAQMKTRVHSGCDEN
jgi:hypothetical protein